jgi:hypothetical protein
MKSRKGWLALIRKFILGAHDIALLATSLAVLILLISLCWYADSNDLWPAGPWGEYEGNHGPWRARWLCNLQAYDAPLCIVNRTLWGIFELQLVAITLSAGGLLFSRKLNRVILLVLQFLYCSVLVYNYYWLID